MGGHVGAYPAVLPPDGPAQQLDFLARALRVVHVRQGDAGDPLGGHLLRADVPPKGNVRQNANLAAGVMALHVGGGVPFGVALLLGLPERRAEGEPRPDHPRENIIGSAVENAVDFQNLIGGQALAQGPDDGDAAPHAGLKEIAHALLPRQLGELIAAGGHQLLI